MRAGSLLGIERKQGVLVTEGTPEPSVAFELGETKSTNFLTSGWSLDVITTHARGGLGIAKDIYENPLFEVDVGGYLTQDYGDLFRGRIDPAFGVGLNVKF